MQSMTYPALPRGWKAEWNDTYHAWYYVNLQTRVSQWERPVRAAEEPVSRLRYEIPKNLPQGWKAEWDKRYRQWYYANVYTGISQWDRPTGPAYNSRGIQGRQSRMHPANSLHEKEQKGERTHQLALQKKSSGQKLDVEQKAKQQDEEGKRQILSAYDGYTRHRSTSNKILEDENSDAFIAKTGKSINVRRPSVGQRRGLKSEVRYEKLLDKKAFRIFELHKGSATEPLSGTLRQPVHVDWGLGFDALSYRWTDPIKETVITINGVELNIGQNLHAALIQFRSDQIPRWMWVDQICINQKDEDEKLSQIRTMPEIYSKARKVLVWLGEAGDQSEVAMEFYPIFVEQIRHNETTAHVQDFAAPPTDVIESEGALATIMKRLFERSWFGRMWTLLEAALGTDVEVWCGKSSFPFRVLENFQRRYEDDLYGHWANALNLIRSSSGGADPENPDRPLNAHIYVISILKARDTTSVRILDSLRRLDCSKDEDRIRSVLHFLNADLVENIMRQKELSPADLYQLVASHELQRGKLEHLGAAGISQHRLSYMANQKSSKSPCLLLPSWVPDWTFKPRTYNYWALNRLCLSKRNIPLFTAGGSPLPDFPWQSPDDDNILLVKGIVLESKVGKCEAPFRFTQVPEDLSNNTAKTETAATGIEAIRAQVASCIELAAKCKPRHASSDILRDCRRALLGGMMPEGFVCVPVTDQVVHSLFEDFRTYFDHFQAMQHLSARLKLIQIDNQLPEITEEDQVRIMELARTSEEMKDMHKKNNLTQAMADACKGRRFFITDCRQYMGVAPDITEPKDKICIIPGCCAPFIIRPKETGYQLIGECYVAGMMDGEVIVDEENSLETISFE